MLRTLLLIVASTLALAATSVGAVTFVYTGAAQSFTIQNAGIYNVVATGARGGDSLETFGGAGIAVGAHVTLGAATNLDVIVGGVGGSGRGNSGGGGGGGGSFVLGAGASAVVVAGGGGGGGYLVGGSASAGSAGGSGSGIGVGTGGTDGLGGHGGTYSDGFNGGGGAGLFGRGSAGQGKYSAGGGSSAPGFAGGDGTGNRFGTGGYGGFGGGGGANGFGAQALGQGISGGYGGGGGGGGFSGGGGGGGSFVADSHGNTYFGGGGGGGGSFVMAGATNVTSALSSGLDGSVSITPLRLFAQPVLSSAGDGVLTFANGAYVLNLGDVYANTGFRTTELSLLNNVSTSGYSDTLVDNLLPPYFPRWSSFSENPAFAYVNPVESATGVLFTGSGDMGYGPNSATVDFQLWSHFDGLPDFRLPDLKLTLEENVISAPAVPEPSTWSLMLTGLGFLGYVLRRQVMRRA